MISTKTKLPAHTKGSGNIFADLGLPNAEEHQLKAALVVQLKRLMAEREVTQTAAAKLVEMKQPDSSKVLRGQFKLVSIEKADAHAFHGSTRLCFRPPYSAASAGALFSSENFAAMVGLPRVSFLIVTSCALSFARRRLRSAPIKASLVFCR
ncbi:putative XRE-type DNA-binding protein [Bradyrhizobium japonicum]